ncbi:MAG: hypothetical protein AAF215_06715 [Cyanobacteria bacterium P01_A01_bin.123]
MSSGDIDRIPVAQLPQRYSLARSAVYTRMDALKIKPERVGNRAYVNAAQVKLLDELHYFIQRGGNTAEFLAMRGKPPAAKPPVDESSDLTITPDNLMGLIRAIASELANQFQPVLPEADPVSHFEKLEQAVKNGWLLSTAEIANLLDLSPSQFQHYDHFQDAGFVFTRAGYRMGGDLAWRVSKMRR